MAHCITLTGITLLLVAAAEHNARLQLMIYQVGSGEKIRGQVARMQTGENIRGNCWRGRPATSKDSPNIVRLFNEVFDGKRSMDHWKWKFLDNPAGNQCMQVAEDRGGIVGHLAILPTWMNLRGEKVMGGQIIDIMTHPAYRKQGMFVSLAKQCFDQAASMGIAMIYVFPNKQSYPGLVKGLACSYMGRLPKLVRILKVKRIIRDRSKSEAIGGLFEKAESILIKLMGGVSRPVTRGHIKISMIEGFDIRFDGLWERMKSKNYVGVWKDSNYLNWRYKLCPDKQYNVMAAEENGTLVGFTVLKCGAFPGRNGYIGNVVEFLCLPEKMAAAELLIDAALQYLKDQGMDAAGCHMFEHSPHYKVFRRKGFFRRRRSYLPFIVRTNNPNLGCNALVNRKEWHMVEGDIDVF